MVTVIIVIAAVLEYPKLLCGSEGTRPFSKCRICVNVAFD
jgi:hypothetical protein